MRHLTPTGSVRLIERERDGPEIAELALYGQGFLVQLRSSVILASVSGNLAEIIQAIGDPGLLS